MQIVALNRANLTSRDLEILDALTLRVRVLSVSQIALTWYDRTAEPARQAARRLAVLEAAGLVVRLSMPARPELVLDRPLVIWEPGLQSPEFDRLAYGLETRWSAPAVPTDMVMASRAAGTCMGGYGGRRPRRSETSHDLTLARLYLSWRGRNPSGDRSWISEAALRQEGFGNEDRLPDAMVEEHGRRRAIELGGVYGATKLRDFHEFCDGHGLPYELW